MSALALLQTCTDLMEGVMRFDHPADSIISRYFKAHRALGQRDRAMLAEAAYGVLRNRLAYEWLASSAPKGMGSLQRRLALLACARQSTAWCNALPAPERDWAQACMQQLARGEGFLDVHRHNLPQWLAQRLQAQWGDDFWPLVNALAQAAPLDLRVNALKAQRDQVKAELAQLGISAVETPLSPWGLRLPHKLVLNTLDVFNKGWVEVQDEGSQLLALLCAAKRGEMVMDFCAGAGGKTLALGAMMRGSGRLYAFDTSQKRLDNMRTRIARSGLSNIHPVVIAHERDERIKRLTAKMDRVLVDAPCSGLGTLRRNPDLKWRQTSDDLARLTALQERILHSAAKLVKSGGRLVYATCSLLREENEVIAQAFTAAHPEFVVLDVGELLQAQKIAVAHSLCSGDADAPTRYLRLGPHRHGTDGFFAAVWQRR